jgi:hypothetical protein
VKHRLLFGFAAALLFPGAAFAQFNLVSPPCLVSGERLSSFNYRGGDGSSPSRAVEILNADSTQLGISLERRYLAYCYPGYSLTRQSLVNEGGKQFDVMSIKLPNGEDRQVFFDISGFFGIEAKRELAAAQAAARPSAPAAVATAPTPKPLSGWPTDMASAMELATQQSQQPQGRAYWAASRSSVEYVEGASRRISTAAFQVVINECITAMTPRPTAIKAVLLIDELGITQRAMSDQSGWLGECVQSKAVGKRMALPPSAFAPPTAYCFAYEGSDDQYSIKPCFSGYSPSATRCEQRGNTLSCSVYR